MARKAGFDQRALDRLDQVGLTKLHRRKIDRDGQRARPRRRLAAGLAQYPFADLLDGAALLGDRNEQARRNEAAARMAPARQGLEAEYLARHIRLRLVMDAQLPQRDRGVELVPQRAALAQLGIHL